MASEKLSLYRTGPYTLLDATDSSSIEYSVASSCAARVFAAGLYILGVAVMYILLRARILSSSCTNVKDDPCSMPVVR